MVQIHGSCHKKFLAVRESFESNFLNGDEVGGAVAVYYKGAKVVDLWAGYKNKETSVLWAEDTLVPFFSVTKGLTALCFLMLAERKKIKYENPVSFYWPEFGKNGKEAITVKELLEHRAGLHALDKKLDMEDFWKNPKKVYEALVSQKASYMPGTNQGYGAQIWGAYAAELFFQITGETAGVFFKREIANKLKLNLHLGLPESQQNKVAKLYPVSAFDRIKLLLPQIIKGEGSEGRAGRDILFGNGEVKRAYLNPSVGLKGLEMFNDPILHKQELLWANGIGDARSLAKMYDMLANGGKKGLRKFVSPKLLKILAEKNPLKYDIVIHKPLGWSLGFLKEEIGLFSPNYEAFGHAGMGGSLGFADPKAKIAMGYVCNKMDYRVRAPKTLNLCAAIYQSIQ